MVVPSGNKSPARERERESRHVFLSPLSHNTHQLSCERIQQYFLKFGQIQKTTRENGGFVVSFGDVGSARRAVAAGEKRLDGCFLKSSYHQVPPSQPAAPSSSRITAPAIPPSTSNVIAVNGYADSSGNRLRHSPSPRTSRERLPSNAGRSCELAASGQQGIYIERIPRQLSPQQIRDGIRDSLGRGEHGEILHVEVQEESGPGSGGNATGVWRRALVIFQRVADVARLLAQSSFHLCGHHCRLRPAAPAAVSESYSTLLAQTSARAAGTSLHGMGMGGGDGHLPPLPIHGMGMGGMDSHLHHLSRPLNGGSRHPGEVDVFMQNSSRILYVGGLESRVSEESLRRRFEKFGCILDVEVKNFDSPSPFAFLQFDNIASVVTAINAHLHHTNQRRRPNFGRTPQSSRLWIGCLPPGEDEEFLRQKLRSMADLGQEVLMNYHRREALIVFNKPDHAKSVLEKIRRGHTFPLPSSGERDVRLCVDYCSERLYDHFLSNHNSRCVSVDASSILAPDSCLLVPPPAPPPQLRPTAGSSDRVSNNTSSSFRRGDSRKSPANSEKEGRRKESDRRDRGDRDGCKVSDLKLLPSAAPTLNSRRNASASSSGTSSRSPSEAASMANSPCQLKRDAKKEGVNGASHSTPARNFPPKNKKASLHSPSPNAQTVIADEYRSDSGFCEEREKDVPSSSVLPPLPPPDLQEATPIPKAKSDGSKSGRSDTDFVETIQLSPRTKQGRFLAELDLEGFDDETRESNSTVTVAPLPPPSHFAPFEMVSATGVGSSHMKQKINALGAKLDSVNVASSPSSLKSGDSKGCDGKASDVRLQEIREKFGGGKKSLRLNIDHSKVQQAKQQRPPSDDCTPPPCSLLESLSSTPHTSLTGSFSAFTTGSPSIRTPNCTSLSPLVNGVRVPLPVSAQLNGALGVAGSAAASSSTSSSSSSSQVAARPSPLHIHIPATANSASSQHSHSAVSTPASVVSPSLSSRRTPVSGSAIRSSVSTVAIHPPDFSIPPPPIPIPLLPSTSAMLDSPLLAAPPPPPQLQPSFTTGGTGKGSACSTPPASGARRDSVGSASSCSTPQLATASARTASPLHSPPLATSAGSLNAWKGGPMLVSAVPTSRPCQSSRLSQDSGSLHSSSGRGAGLGSQTSFRSSLPMPQAKTFGVRHDSFSASATVKTPTSTGPSLPRTSSLSEKPRATPSNPTTPSTNSIGPGPSSTTPLSSHPRQDSKDLLDRILHKAGDIKKLQRIPKTPSLQHSQGERRKDEKKEREKHREKEHKKKREEGRIETKEERARRKELKKASKSREKERPKDISKSDGKKDKLKEKDKEKNRNSKEKDREREKEKEKKKKRQLSETEGDSDSDSDVSLDFKSSFAKQQNSLFGDIEWQLQGTSMYDRVKGRRSSAAQKNDEATKKKEALQAIREQQKKKAQKKRVHVSSEEGSDNDGASSMASEKRKRQKGKKEEAEEGELDESSEEEKEKDKKRKKTTKKRKEREESVEDEEGEDEEDEKEIRGKSKGKAAKERKRKRMKNLDTSDLFAADSADEDSAGPSFLKREESEEEDSSDEERKSSRKKDKEISSRKRLNSHPRPVERKRSRKDESVSISESESVAASTSQRVPSQASSVKSAVQAKEKQRLSECSSHSSSTVKREDIEEEKVSAQVKLEENDEKTVKAEESTPHAPNDSSHPRLITKAAMKVFGSASSTNTPAAFSISSPSKTKTEEDGSSETGDETGRAAALPPAPSDSRIRSLSESSEAESASSDSTTESDAERERRRREAEKAVVLVDATAGYEEEKPLPFVTEEERIMPVQSPAKETKIVLVADEEAESAARDIEEDVQHETEGTVQSIFDDDDEPEPEYPSQDFLRDIPDTIDEALVATSEVEETGAENGGRLSSASESDSALHNSTPFPDDAGNHGVWDSTMDVDARMDEIEEENMKRESPPVPSNLETTKQFEPPKISPYLPPAVTESTPPINLPTHTTSSVKLMSLPTKTFVHAFSRGASGASSFLPSSQPPSDGKSASSPLGLRQQPLSQEPAPFACPSGVQSPCPQEEGNMESAFENSVPARPSAPLISPSPPHDSISINQLLRIRQLAEDQEHFQNKEAALRDDSPPAASLQNQSFQKQLIHMKALSETSRSSSPLVLVRKEGQEEAIGDLSSHSPCHTPLLRPPSVATPTSSSAELAAEQSRQITRNEQFLNRYPRVWDGQLAIKGNEAKTLWYSVTGSCFISRRAFRLHQPSLPLSCIRINQRMRLTQQQTNSLRQKMKDDRFATMICVPCGTGVHEIKANQAIFKKNFIEYFDSKAAAGIANIDHEDGSFCMHIFSPCDFVTTYLSANSAELLNSLRNQTTYLFVVLTQSDSISASSAPSSGGA